MVMSIRPARLEDSQFLFDWRNDPVTRWACRNTEPVPWADHIGWLKSTLANPKRRLLVVELDEVPVAQCRFDYDDPTEFTIAIAPEARGQGFSRDIAALMFAAEPHFVLYIKRKNIACRKLMAHAGAVLIEDGEMMLWHYDAPQTISKYTEFSSTRIKPAAAMPPPVPWHAAG
jgi:RimJ/RimL family protein N-acetyltransferase